MLQSAKGKDTQGRVRFEVSVVLSHAVQDTLLSRDWHVTTNMWYDTQGHLPELQCSELLLGLHYGVMSD